MGRNWQTNKTVIGIKSNQTSIEEDDKYLFMPIAIHTS